MIDHKDNPKLSIVNCQLSIKFGEYLKTERLSSPHTVRAYLDDLAAFTSFVGDQTPIEQCTVTDLRAYLMVMIERGDSPRSINRRISSLRRFYNYLVRSAVIDVDPTAKIRSVKTPQRLPHFVPENQINSIIEKLDGAMSADHYIEVRDAVIVALLYMTGMRRAELAALRVESVNFERSCIKIVGKGDKERLLPLSDELTTILRQYLSKRDEFCCTGEQKSLFLNKKPEAVSEGEIYRVVRRVLKEAGVEARQSPHTLRHSFATHLLSHQVSIRSIQELLGHASISSTQIYTHNTIESLKEAFAEAHPRQKR